MFYTDKYFVRKVLMMQNLSDRIQDKNMNTNSITKAISHAP